MPSRFLPSPRRLLVRPRNGEGTERGAEASAERLGSEPVPRGRVSWLGTSLGGFYLFLRPRWRRSCGGACRGAPCSDACFLRWLFQGGVSVSWEDEVHPGYRGSGERSGQRGDGEQHRSPPQGMRPSGYFHQDWSVIPFIPFPPPSTYPWISVPGSSRSLPLFVLLCSWRLLLSYSSGSFSSPWNQEGFPPG